MTSFRKLQKTQVFLSLAFMYIPLFKGSAESV